VKVIASVLTGVVALSHIGFLVLEMFFWDHPVGRRIFGMTPEVSAGSAALAANQGLYMIVAGVFGGLTAKTSILFTQALPAAFALALVLVAARRSRA